MIRRISLALALVLALSVTALPAGAASRESGCRDIAAGGGTFEPTEAGLPDIPPLLSDDVYSGGQLLFQFKLAAPSCEKVTYSVAVHGEQTSESEIPPLLASFDVAAPGSDTFVVDEAIDTAVTPCVSVVVTASVKGEVVDRAPDSGFPNVCSDGGGGQGWN